MISFDIFVLTVSCNMLSATSESCGKQVIFITQGQENINYTYQEGVHDLD